MKPSDMLAWLRKSEPGDVLLYHTGFLARDRETHKGVDKLATAMALAQEVGKVRLFQVRVYPGQFVYFAKRIATHDEQQLALKQKSAATRQRVAEIGVERRAAEKAYRRA